MTPRMLLAFAALGTGYLLLETATHPVAIETGPTVADLTRLIGTRTNADLGTVVTTPAGTRARDFRALMPVADRLQTVYGRARADCMTRAGTPGCWRIDYVEVDGKPSSLVAEPTPTAIETSEIRRAPERQAPPSAEQAQPLPPMPGAERPASAAPVAWRMAAAAFRSGIPLPPRRPGHQQ